MRNLPQEQSLPVLGTARCQGGTWDIWNGRHAYPDLADFAGHWLEWWRRFSPASGSDPKLEDPFARYILATFTYGTNLGPAQAARHIAGVTAHELSATSARHVTTGKLNRAIADESLNLPRQAVRLLEQWLAHSALLRSHAEPGQRRDLWLRLRKPGGTEISAESGSASRVAVQRWIERHQVDGDDGRPLKIHRSRIRTTHLSMRDKRTWAGRGRATIDPNHSPEVEGDHYPAPAPAAAPRPAWPTSAGAS